MLDNEIGGANSATEENTNGSTGETAQTSRPRRASRPAGPPPEFVEEPTPAPAVEKADNAVSGENAVSAESGEAVPAKAESPPTKRTRTRRSAARSAAPAPEPESAGDDAKPEVRTEAKA